MMFWFVTQFQERSDLRLHEKFHDNVRPYKCHDCDKAFIKKSHLQQHVLVRFFWA